MNFDTFFKFISYAAVFCGFLALWVAGTFGIIGTALFMIVTAAAWYLEGSRWQLSERLGTALIVLALPVYYIASRMQIVSIGASGALIAGTLGRLILTLTCIKLLQKKSDRDWVFLYLMAFFEVLLAAGLSISAMYLASLVLYLLVMVCAIIAFEIRRSSMRVAERTRDLIKHDGEEPTEAVLPLRRLPAISALLIAIIVCIGLPLFFFLPRVGGAGFGGSEHGVQTRTGFSDVVQLGNIGKIQQSDDIVMRARIDGHPGEQPDLYWRGIALDTFDGKAWGRSNLARDVYAKGDRDLIPLDLASSRESILSETIYLEPLDTSVLFGLPKIVGIQTNLPAVSKDADGGISSTRAADRISYRILSDRSTTPIEELRADNKKYSPDEDRFLELPGNVDPRIEKLAAQVTSAYSNRYDKAKAVEQYLQTNFGYTLELKAGGADPLADFLFNVRQGHCEYFATAMAIMLRTQGIATRVVNGFHQGDYNEAADIWVVRQKNAHSWVEVYFPKPDTWVKFDPTPPAGQVAPSGETGFVGTINKYFEALETYWIQYFVSYDKREQRTLANSVRSGLGQYQHNLRSFLDSAQDELSDWWAEVKGERGPQASLSTIGYTVAYAAAAAAGLALFVWFARKVVKLKVWHRLADRFRGRRNGSIIQFYDRMLQILASKGFEREPHQTPLEFAYAIGMPEAVNITEKYNRVRFGEKVISSNESDEIERWLEEISATNYTSVTNKEPKGK
jgi:transglutaminase-like putative cysteine protease